MSAAAIVGMMEEQRIIAIVAYFRERAALSKDRAIDPTTTISTELEKRELSPKEIKQLSFLIRTENGKYFLDEDAYTAFNKKRKFIVIAILFVPLIGILLKFILDLLR